MIDELTLQSLVDGEFSVAERNDLLDQIHAQDASSWRMVALAFVEEQALRAGARSAATEDSAAIASMPRSAVHAEAGKNSARRKLSRVARGMALAASVLVLAGVGYFWGHADGKQAQADQARPGTNLAMDDAGTRGSDATLGSGAAANNPATTMVSFPANPAAIDPWLTEPWADELRTQWLQSGFLVDPRPVPISITLPGGGTAEVILSDPQVKFVGNAAFQ